MDTITKNPPVESVKQKDSKYRYRILALLFMATTINYMDRSIMGVLAPTLEGIFDWSKSDYASINIAFKAAYAIGLISMGTLIDKMGTRIGYTVSIAIWSVFGMAHSLLRPAFGLIGFMMARFGLGFGEAGNFPAAVKTVAEWFPKKDRAFATGIFNAGSNVGAFLAPIVVTGILTYGGTEAWPFTFLVTGFFSALWVFLWLKFYKKPQDHPSVNETELNYIQQDEDSEEVKEENLPPTPLSKIATKKQTWAFTIGKLTDGVWYFFMFWSGMFFHDKFGMSIKELGAAYAVMYLIADLGSIGGGYLSKFFIERGWSLNSARKISLLICALCIAPVSIATITESAIIAACLIALASGGHQAWSCNLFTVASDLLPKPAVARTVGFGSMFGALSGMLIDFLLGRYLDHLGNDAYFWMFLVAGLSYLVVLFILHMIVPDYKPLKQEEL
ncbi:MFS transporter [Flammeovirga yaeyamensis]|uniref:MFS transporter n=1 Tax=Flammeovirga yaeyamensis TaxID=367791 RepID=A0AAX1N2K1_9BACT|nr:MFS transporter [Flammeovirga yaeyamensis]MBB3700771.1 ACS family hexuronate transporter-like MFS transporter [Flammeovirga yaeyamensis]NMF37873.1 MFS transporter [Flammeovirga yaeyamensis]QWG01765.1 MFS transporter [Flammeovirga yaeyamensis]